MSTLAVLEARVALLEARLDALEKGAPSGGNADANGEGETLGDHVLDKPWADKRIQKNPKRWTGPTQVGRSYSEAPAEWLRMMASFYDWKAQKGREETPVRLRNDGKPWHESDTFEAKLLRTWARRNAQRPPAPSPSATELGSTDSDDSFDFGANVADPDLRF